MGRRQLTKGRLTFVLSASFVGLLVAGGVTLAIVSALGGVDEPGAVASPSPAPSQQLERCEAGPVELTGRVDVAPDADWARAGTTEFPTPHGAQASTDGLWECWDQTPTGAVFAAAGGFSQIQDSDPEKRLLAAEELITEGPVRDELIASFDSYASPSDATTGTRVRVAGFRLLDYDGHEAHVDVLFSYVGGGSTGYLSSVVPVTWNAEKGDWRLTFTERDVAPPAVLPNAAGYVLWEVPVG